MQTITTRYIGPTNLRGTRISASAQAGRKFYPWQYHLNAEQNHRRAAAKFAEAMNWPAQLATGQTHKGETVHVMISKWEPPQTPAEILAETGPDDD
jgi:hypothetical protein